MAFDFETQKICQLMGAILEFGSVSFTTTSLTVEVPTKRSKILMAIGVTEDGTGVISDKTVTAGALTMTRLSGGTSGASMDYIILGH